MLELKKNMEEVRKQGGGKDSRLSKIKLELQNTEIHSDVFNQIYKKFSATPSSGYDRSRGKRPVSADT
jgi:hypothetical protein